MATTRTSSAGKVSFGSWESEEREHPQGCSFFCALSSARGFCSPKGLLLPLHRAGGESKGPFSFAKENGPFGTPRERLRLAVSSSNDFCASGVEVPAWRHCCARRIEQCSVRRKLGCTSTRWAERQRMIEAEANRLAMLTRLRRAQGSAIGKHCSSSSCSLAMGNAFLLDGHTARFLSRERKWGVCSCRPQAAYPSALCAENIVFLLLQEPYFSSGLSFASISIAIV